MIRTFHDADTKRVWDGIRVKRFEAIAKRAQTKLSYLWDATGLADLQLPGLRIEMLKGERKGQYSIRVNDQYRICFEWRNDGAYEVELTDYH